MKKLVIGCVMAAGNPSPEEDDDWLGHGVQSYGQLVSHGLKAVIPNPGTACRGYASMR